MKAQRKNLLRVIIIVLVVLVVLATMCAVGKGFFGGPEICTDKQCFQIEIADTPETRAIGLMDRTSLDEDKGMLFIFQQAGQYSFWMKNTLIPLDMIRLDQDYKILFIQDMAEPCTADPCPLYGPLVSASYVLELNGGAAKTFGLQAGESMKFKE